jgi:hypothetical protein
MKFSEHITELLLICNSDQLLHGAWSHGMEGCSGSQWVLSAEDLWENGAYFMWGHATWLTAHPTLKQAGCCEMVQDFFFLFALF